MKEPSVSEMAKAKLLFVGVVLFIVSGIASCEELRYAAWGRRVDAALVATRNIVEAGGRGRSVPKLQIDYTFTEPGGAARRESDVVGEGFEFARTAETDAKAGELADHERVELRTVPVQYIPGSPGDSRLAGHTKAGLVYLFFGSLALMGFGLWRFWVFYES